MGSFEGELREILNQTIFDDQILKYFDQIHVFPFTDKIPSYFWENKLSQKIVKDGNPELILEAIKYCKNHNNLEILFQGLLNEHFSEEEIISTWSYLQQILSKEKDILFQFEMKLCRAVSLYGSDNMIDRILAIGVDKRAKLYLIKNKNYRYYGDGIKS